MPLDDYTIKSYAEKFGSEICCSIVKNLTYLEHVHRSYEILYLLKGQIETEVQGHRFTLNKGDLLFIANGCCAQLCFAFRVAFTVGGFFSAGCPAIYYDIAAKWKAVLLLTSG